MHFGRNHTIGEAIVALVGGLTASFLTFTVTMYTQYYGHNMQGQLLAGDPSLNREFPTTLNTMHGAMDGQNPILESMGSYGFWVVVVIGGLIAAFIILKLMRRFV